MDKDDIEDVGTKGNMQVISRAAAILRAIAAHPGGLSLNAIAKEVELPRSTVQRLVTALEVEGLLDPKGPAGGTRLGPAMGHFLAAAHADMIIFGRSYLKQLVEDASETASVICTVGGMGMVLESFAYDHPLRVVLLPGTQYPLYATAGGKAILARSQDSAIKQLFPAELPACTPHTLSSRAALLDELQTVRDTHMAYARQEHTLGLSSIAVAIDSHTGLYAFEVTLPEARFDEKREVVEKALLKSVEMIQSYAPQAG